MDDLASQDELAFAQWLARVGAERRPLPERLDGLEPWEQLLLDTCGACGMKSLTDERRTCPACGAIKSPDWATKNQTWPLDAAEVSPRA